MSIFQPATRRRVFLKLALQGPSGSGKTYSALRLAFGMGEKVALVDTENESASLYAGVGKDGIGDFDSANIEPPFDPKKYITAIEDAVKAGYDVLIIDSFSHAWKEILNMKEAFDRQGGNGFANWAKVKPLADRLKQAILQSDIHVICCMRAKDEYILDDKNKPQKVGMGAIQEPGVEYEFTTVFDIGMDHKASTSKDRTGLFADEIQLITPDHGKRLMEWLGGAAEPRPRAASVQAPSYDPGSPASAGGEPAPSSNGVNAAIKAFREAAKAKGWALRVTDMPAAEAWIRQIYPSIFAHKPEIKDWTAQDWTNLVGFIPEQPTKTNGAAPAEDPAPAVDPLKAAIREFRAKAKEKGFNEQVADLPSVSGWAEYIAPALFAQKPNAEDWTAEEWRMALTLIPQDDPFAEDSPANTASLEFAGAAA